MSIPDYQSIMLPLLQFSGDQQEHSLRETIEVLADQFNLTDQERKDLLPSGLISVRHRGHLQRQFHHERN